MALPKDTETPQSRRLMGIVEGAGNNILGQWPWPNESDLRLFGGYLNIYSCVDFELFRAAEVLEEAKLFPSSVTIKVAKMTITDVQRALMAMPPTKVNIPALERLIEYRGVRNLLAHFVVRRFPNDDAYLFTTRSVRDFKREMGREPLPNELMIFVVERHIIVRQIEEVFRIHNGMVRGTNTLGEMYGIT